MTDQNLRKDKGVRNINLYKEKTYYKLNIPNKTVMEKEILISLIPPTITLIITSLFGLFVGVLVEKFRNRFRTIEYSIRSQRIIPPLSNNLGEQISIKLNDREINTLKVATVEIENVNSIDIENVIVRFSLGRNSWFQGNEAYISKNFTNLNWMQNYTDNFEEVVKDYSSCVTDEKGEKIISEELQNRINYVLGNRDYIIPVFNRKEKAIFNFLIEDPIDGSEAGIFPSIVHKSVNFIQKSDDAKQKQRDLWLVVGIGTIVVSIIVILIVLQNPEQRNLIILSAIVGLSYSTFGILLLFGFRKIKSFFK